GLDCAWQHAKEPENSWGHRLKEPEGKDCAWQRPTTLARTNCAWYRPIILRRAGCARHRLCGATTGRLPDGPQVNGALGKGKRLRKGTGQRRTPGKEAAERDTWRPSGVAGCRLRGTRGKNK